MNNSTLAVGISARVRHAEHVMGTVVSFDVPVFARREGILQAAVRWLHWVDRVFSPYRPDSDVSLLACAFLHDASGGYFTATPGGQFDPSGFVKGWAVERASRLLSAAGSTDHLVNGGGDVQCTGGRTPGHRAGQPDGGGAQPDVRRRVCDRGVRHGRRARQGVDRIPGGLRGLRDHR